MRGWLPMAAPSLPTLVNYTVLIGAVAGVIFWAQGEFASAGGMQQQFQAQAISQQELFNENRMQRLQHELNQIRVRQRAGVVYPEDAQTIQFLQDELRRAREYAELLRKNRANLK